MLNKQGSDLPQPVLLFLRNLDGALGDRLIGAILFGSQASNSASPKSDIDLAVVVSDADGERSRHEVFRVLGVSGVDRTNVSLSVETYMRLKEFLRVGDPFAWVVCADGRILRDRDGLLADLQRDCKQDHAVSEREALVRYLQGKSILHYSQAMQAFQQFLANIQLSMMAGAQAVVAHDGKGEVVTTELLGMASWEMLKAVLQKTTATKREIETVEMLIMAHKLARQGDTDYAGEEAIAMLRRSADLWRRLLPSDSLRT
ncbi:MAG: nucleotidyltransferase domain-containing protein [Phycisphaerae bacterium]